MPIGDGGGGPWGSPPSPGDGAGNETRLGYQLANFRDLTNQRFGQLEAAMREGFAAVNKTIESQQYVTRERFDLEIKGLQDTQKEQRATITKLWWLLGATVLSMVAEAAMIVAMSRGGP